MFTRAEASPLVNCNPNDLGCLLWNLVLQAVGTERDPGDQATGRDAGTGCREDFPFAPRDTISGEPCSLAQLRGPVAIAFTCLGQDQVMTLDCDSYMSKEAHHPLSLLKTLETSVRTTISRVLCTRPLSLRCS